MFWCNLAGANRPPNKQVMPVARHQELGLCVLWSLFLSLYSPFHAVKKWHRIFKRKISCFGILW